jgi:hypothetical protein
LGKAVKNLKRELLVQKSEIQLYNRKEIVDASIPISGSYSNAIGFKKEGNEYLLVGDSADLGRNQSFISQLKQQYALEVAKKEFTDQGLTISNMQVNSKGNIEIEVVG